MTPQASKTYEVWIPLNPSVFSSGCLRISNGVFPHFSLFEFYLFPLIHYCWMPFTVGCPSFYSAILGFLGYHWFPLFTPLGTRTNVVSATLVAGPFLILHYFPLLRFPLQKSLADFPVLKGFRGLTFDLSFSKASRFHLFRPTFLDPPFGCFPFCHFSQIGWFLSIRLKDPQPPSFMVHLPRFPKVPDPYSWVVGSQVFWSFSASLGGWWDIFALVLRVFGHAFLNCLSLNLALLHISRIPSSWESPSILVQFSPRAPQWFSYL